MRCTPRVSSWPIFGIFWQYPIIYYNNTTCSPESLEISSLISCKLVPRGCRPAVCLILAVNDVFLVLSGLVVSTAASELRGSKPQLVALMCGVGVFFPVLCGFFHSAPVSSTTTRLIFTPINRIWNKKGKSIIFVSAKTFIALPWHDC